jgi:multidrug efflux pump subunit AcrA (membrane-fusion protein)
MFFAAVVGASLLAACGADPGAAAPAATNLTTPVTTPVTTHDTTPAEVPSSLQFSADLVAGGTVDFRSYAGTTLALWFWAPT